MPPQRRVTFLRPEEIDHEQSRLIREDELQRAPQSFTDWLMEKVVASRPQPLSAIPSLDTAVESLPMVGGIAGGILGGVGGTVAGFGVGGVPGAVGGAAVGGAGGESLRRTIQQLRGTMPVDRSVGETLAGVGTEGAKQGAYELGGQGLMRAAQPVGRFVYRQAVGRLPDAITSAFPNVVETLWKNRVPLSEAGRAQVVAARGEAAKGVKALLQKATDAGTTFDAHSVLGGHLYDLIDQIGAIPAGSAEERALSTYIDDYLARHPGPLTPLALKEMKQAAQQISSGLFDAAAKGGVVGAEAGTYGKFNQAIAKDAQAALETIPGVGAGEKEVQSLIGAGKAMRQIVRRPPGVGMRIVPKATGLMSAVIGELLLPHGGTISDVGRTAIEYGVGDLLGHFAASPEMLSRGALVLTQPQIAALFRQSPRLAAEVLSRMEQYANTPPEQYPPGGGISIGGLEAGPK
jgi:hypothetical protein